MLSRRRYPSDLTDEQWERIKRYFRQRKRGRKPLHSPREIVNAIFYILRTGCPWRHLPKDLTPVGYSRILLLSLEALRKVAKNLGSAHR